MKLFLTFFAIFAFFSSISSKKSLKKLQEMPRSLSALKQMLFPKPLIPQNLSEIEESPSEFSLLSPFPSKSSRLSSSKISRRDPSAYTLQAANLSDIRENQVYLVKNQSLLRLLVRKRLN